MFGFTKFAKKIKLYFSRNGNVSLLNHICGRSQKPFHFLEESEIGGLHDVRALKFALFYFIALTLSLSLFPSIFHSFLSLSLALSLSPALFLPST